MRGLLCELKSLVAFRSTKKSEVKVPRWFRSDFSDQRTAVFAFEDEHVLFDGVGATEFLLGLVPGREAPCELRVIGQIELERSPVVP